MRSVVGECLGDYAVMKIRERSQDLNAFSAHSDEPGHEASHSTAKEQRRHVRPGSTLGMGGPLNIISGR